MASEVAGAAPGSQGHREPCLPALCFAGRDEAQLWGWSPTPRAQCTPVPETPLS